MRNPANAPSDDKIRNAGAVPWASQIPNDTEAEGNYVSDVLSNMGERLRAVVSDLAIDTLNDEQSVALGGVASKQFAPTHAIVQMATVSGAAAAGDFQISIGITSGGTEILAATACTGVIAIDTKLIIDLSAVVKPALPASSTLYVKVTTADTTAGAGHLAKVYVVGEVIATEG